MSNRDAPLHERALHVGSQFESLLAEISGTLARLRPAEVGHGVESVLERLGAFLQVDHAFVVDLRHESDGRAAGWFNSQPGPEGPAIAQALRSRAGWLRRRAEEGDEIVASCGDEVPEPFQAAGARSLLMLPLAVAGTPLGVLGLATSRAERAWPAGFIRRARLIGELLACALLRGRSDRSLEQGYRFERVIADLAAVLLDPPEGDPDLEIEDALEALGEIAAVGAVRLFRIRDGGGRLEPAREWTDGSGAAAGDAGAATGPADAGGADREPSLRWMTRRLLRGEDVVLASLDDLPPDATRERRHFENSGTTAFARLPLHLGSDLVGVLGLDAASGPRDWSEDLLERVRFAGRVLLWAMKGGRPGPTVVTHGPGLALDETAPPPRDAAPGLTGSAMPVPNGLPALETLPAGSTVMVLGDRGRGKEIVVRAPVEADHASGPWELQALAQRDAVLPWPGVPAALAPGGAPSAGPSAPPAATVPVIPVPEPHRPAATEALPPGTLHDVERAHVRRVLQECGWKISGFGNAAERLGLAPSTLRYRMGKLGISRPGPGSGA